MVVHACIRLPVFPSPCLYQISCFVRAVIHALHYRSFLCLDAFIIHASYSFVVHVLHSSIDHLSASLNLFMRCILSLFSCISHSAWSPPDQCSGDHYSCVALIYFLCVALIHSCIGYTALPPRLVSVFPFMYHIHGLMLPSLFPLLCMYQVEYSVPRWRDTSRWV